MHVLEWISAPIYMTAVVGVLLQQLDHTIISKSSFSIGVCNHTWFCALYVHAKIVHLAPNLCSHNIRISILSSCDMFLPTLNHWEQNIIHWSTKCHYNCSTHNIKLTAIFSSRFLILVFLCLSTRTHKHTTIL